MANNKNGAKSNHFLRRAVSLEPRMASGSEKSSPGIHVNPLYEDHSERPADERNSSIKRQASEPARNRFNVLKTNIVTRAESIKSVLKKGTAEFFVVSEDKDSQNQKWDKRRMRFFNNYGKLKEQAVPQTSRRAPTNQATGFDEIDGVLPTNAMTGFSESAPQYVPELSSELDQINSRSPAIKVTFKAIVAASSAIRRKVSTRADHKVSTHADQKVSKRTESELMSERAFDWSGSGTTADSVFAYPEDLTGEYDENFFQKPSISSTDEADYNLRNRNQIAYFDNRWTLQRQTSAKAKSIPEQIINNYLDNSNRREYGLGFVGKLLNRRLKKGAATIDHIDDYRPFFTYWVTTVQILILIISLSAYGFGHYGFGSAHISGLVLVTSLSLQQVDYFEPENFWGGPRAADLVHLGAKFTPCMRKDLKVYELINEQRRIEERTGCCIRNDGSGCVQSSKDSCSPLLSTWHKWNNSTNRGPSYSTSRRISGPVCGQDPQFCDQPASIEPYEWPDNITEWPICSKKGTERSYLEDHLKCELIGRPCCLGIYGQCHITTREYCDFARGFFHEDATLCSQVSCMENVCGMIPFYSKDTPNQFYRIWTPIFLHAGLGHLIITVIFQIFIMRDMEKLLGVTRIAIIYLVSGIGGYLASAIFIPFRAEVGPAGSQFGILSTLVVEVVNNWDRIEEPTVALLKLMIPAFFLFLIGLLPWIDNYAHFGGFIIGLLLSFALLPPVNNSDQNDQTRRILLIIACLVSVNLIIIILFIILYEVPIYDNLFFKYFNCVPLTDNWCANQDIQISRVDIL